MAVGKDEILQQHPEPLRNLPSATEGVEGGSGQTGQKDSALALGTGGAGIQFGRDPEGLATPLFMEAQRKWRGNLQLAQAVLEYPPIRPQEAARKNAQKVSRNRSEGRGLAQTVRVRPQIGQKGQLIFAEK